MKSVKKIIIFSLFLVLLSSCAGPQKLSQQAIFEQYPGIATLKQSLDKGKEDELMIFAPVTYQSAVETYEQAIESGKNRSAETPAIAQRGQKELSRAQSIAAQSRDILEEVVIAREKAKKVNVYNQMAQVLAGFDADGVVRRFDADGDLVASGAKLDEVIFINFSRLLTKDEIKKGTFSLELDVDSSFTEAANPMNLRRIKLFDKEAENNYFINSPLQNITLHLGKIKA